MSSLPITGPPATGDDFFGRRAEQARLWRRLEANHVLLLAPRRVGKTSLMLQMKADAAEHGMSASYRSVASAKDELDFIRALYNAAIELDGSVLQRLSARAGFDRLRALIPETLSVGDVSWTFGVDAASQWRELGEAIATTLSAGSDRTFLLLVDELPMFVVRLLRDAQLDRARAFLEWFRDLRQRLPRVRWMLAGSVGLDSLAEAWRLSSTINDLHAFHLAEFSPAEVDAFLATRTQAAGFSLTPAARAVLLRRVGWPIPYFLARFITALDDARDGLVDVTDDMVDRAFDELTSVHQRTVYSHWNERLDEQLTPAQATLARRILSIVALAPDGASADSLGAVDAGAQPMLNLLLADGYIAQDTTSRWRFRSPLLHTYWKRFVCGRNV